MRAQEGGHPHARKRGLTAEGTLTLDLQPRTEKTRTHFCCLSSVCGICYGSLSCHVPYPDNASKRGRQRGLSPLCCLEGVVVGRLPQLFPRGQNTDESELTFQGYRGERGSTCKLQTAVQVQLLLLNFLPVLITLAEGLIQWFFVVAVN